MSRSLKKPPFIHYKLLKEWMMHKHQEVSQLLKHGLEQVQSLQISLD